MSSFLVVGRHRARMSIATADTATSAGSVTMAFTFKGHLEQTMNCSAGAGAGPDLNAVTDTTTFEYSGVHDHGKLPVLKTDGPVAAVLANIMEAKRQSDEYLTNCIDVEYGGAVEEGSKMKKSRT